MGRVPCCEKMGMKKGPWTPQEDQILVSFIQQFGHSNWRALPKQAGLLRCGKSCRLRWINYLRPGIKRGNFTPQEQQTIINLHQILGNRWSAIAAKLPGRMDNEVKNYWHTHIKKKVVQHSGNSNRNSPQMSKEEMILTNDFEDSVQCIERFCNVEEEASSSQQDLTAGVLPVNGFSNVDDGDYWFNLFLKVAGSSTEYNGV